MRDEMLWRYVRYLNCAEELRIIAAYCRDCDKREELLTAAGQHEQMALSLFNTSSANRRRSLSDHREGD